MNLLPGEIITLDLPGFRKASPWNATVDFVVSPGGALSSVFFNSTLQQLNFVIGRQLPPDVHFNVTVLRSSRIYVPHDGLRWNQTKLALSSQALDGLVLPIDVQKANAVGTMFGTVIGADVPFLEYEPRVPGEAATLYFHFVCSMLVDVNESFVIHLPEFMIETKSSALVSIPLPLPFRLATWSGSSSSLVLIVADRIEPKAPLYVIIPSSVGFLLPARGMTKHHWLTIGINAAAGLRSPIRLHTRPLGAFVNGQVNLRYRSVVHRYTGIAQGKAGMPTELDLQFLPTMSILPGEMITISLPGFLGVQGAGVL